MKRSQNYPMLNCPTDPKRLPIWLKLKKVRKKQLNEENGTY